MSCRGFLLYCGLALCASGFFRSPVVAAFSFRVASVTPASLTSKEQEVQVVLDFSGLPSASYFRVAFQKEGSDSYIGYLKNDRDEWTKIASLGTSDCVNYFSVSDVSSASATLYIKIGEDQAAESGTYAIKAHRYTSSCKSYSAASDATPQKVILTIPTPTATPTSVPTPTLTNPTPTPTSYPAYTQTPITITPLWHPDPYRTHTPTRVPTLPYASDILGIEQEVTAGAAVPHVRLEATTSGNTVAGKERLVLIALLVMSVGVGLLSFALAMKKVEIWKTIMEQTMRYPGK